MINWKTPETDKLVSNIDKIVPHGYAIGLHIRYTTPSIMLQTYDPEWTTRYSSGGYVMTDPSVHWGFANIGATRWSEISLPDPDNVMAQAHDFGLKYGMCVACETGGSRTIANFAHKDREFDDAEMTEIESLLISLHKITLPAVD